MSQQSRKKTQFEDCGMSSRRIPARIVPDDPMFIPMYKTKGSAAADLVANIEADGAGRRELKVGPGHIVTVDCGFRMALEPGWEAQIRARSGLARSAIQVTNGIGTIDDDYRGRVQVILQCGAQCR